MFPIKIKIEAEKVENAFRERKHLLTDKEVEIITRFYGIDDRVRHTLEEIATMYQVTRERIRQIKSGALKKLEVKK
jgi:RNA polymerase primary sigma factor